LVAANAAKTHCPKGHEYNPENTISRRGGRECRACGVEASKARYNNKKNDAEFMRNKREISKRSYMKKKQVKNGGAI
jgi:hypothetical protein